MKAKRKPQLGMVRLQGWGSLSDLKSEGKALRKDDCYLIVRTSGTYFSRDCKFRLDTGKLVGTSETAGIMVNPNDLHSICQRLGVSPPNVQKTPIEESEEYTMALAALKKKVKANSVEKNGKKTLTPGESVNEAIKRGPGRPPKAATEDAPETKPSPKAGQKVTAKVSGKGTGKRGRPRKEVDENAAAKPAGTGKRGRPASYVLPEVPKGNVMIVVSEGAYNNIMENHLPNVRSKKTTDEQKALVERLKAATIVPVKGAHVILNKATAAEFLLLLEKADIQWATMGVSGSHYRRAMVNVSETLRSTFKLKGGLTPKEKPAPVKKQNKPVRKALKAKPAPEDDEEEEEEDDEEEEVKPKVKAKPLVRKSAKGKTKAKAGKTK